MSEIKPVNAEVVDNIPKMEMNITTTTTEPQKEIVSDNQIVTLYEEILGLIRDDRKEVDNILGNFVNMVINEGDASSSSKEALVNLMKIKTDTTNNMSKVMDLLVRMKLKEKDTFPRYLAASQHNEIKISGTSKRKLLESIAKKTKDEKGA
jgi:hypothetical protein